MRKLFLTILLNLFLQHNIQAQQKLLIGTKNYSATNEWSFFYPTGTQTDGDQAYGSLMVSVARTSTNTGYLILTTTVAKASGIFHGAVLLSLNDGSAIICTDRGMYDWKNGTISSIYLLSEKEIEQLKAAEIFKIKFSISSVNFSSQNYSAINGKGKFVDGKGIYDPHPPFKMENDANGKSHLIIIGKEITQTTSEDVSKLFSGN